MRPPAPLTPAEANLRDFQFMPLDVVRFVGSDLVTTEDDHIIVAALRLWCASWHQVPAASLPDDDRSLSNFAGYGKVLTAWAEVKDRALRGFVRCSDGRLYHPVVAEKAREAWTGKLRQRHRTFAATIRKHNERNPRNQIETPSFERWEAMGRPREVAEIAGEPVREPVLPLPGEGDDADVSRVTGGRVTRDKGGVSHSERGRVTRETGSKGQGEGQGQGQGDSLDKQHTEDSRGENVDLSDEDRPMTIPRDDLIAITTSLCRVGAVPLSPHQLTAFNAQISIVEGWIKEGIDPDKTIVPAIGSALATTQQDRISSLRFYDNAVRKAHARSLGAKSGRSSTSSNAPPVAPLRAQDGDDDRVRSIRTALNGNADMAPDKVALAFEDHGDGPVLMVTARSSYVRSRIDLDKLRSIAGTNEIEVRVQ